MYGYAARILKVDLNKGRITPEEYDEAFARKWIGGNGFAASLIERGVPADTDALNERNALVLAVGPITDTPVWGSSRGHAASISPLTGLFGDSNFGGNFAAALKRTGYEAVQVTGRSEKPVYLVVHEGGAVVKDAGHLWGLDTRRTHEAIEAKEGKGCESVCIGPAGENGVLFACIVGSGVRTGAAGRCGLGAVMGDKKLKAIVAVGSRKTQISRPERLAEFLKERREDLLTNTAALSKEGTPFLVEMVNGRGLLGTHNASRETFEYAPDIGAEAMKPYVVKNTACRGCPVACGKRVGVDKGEYAGQSLKMPEYETLYALGSMVDNRNLVSILNANGLCDLLGMDTIGMGVTLAFVAECLERGLVAESDLGGRIDFGDATGLVAAVKATASRTGIGQWLALGSQRLANRFGRDAGKLLYAVKGLEIAGHSARGLRPMALGYATATRGGSHHDTRPKYPVPDEDPGFEVQAEYSFHSQNFTAVGDSLVMCRFTQERGLGGGNNEATARMLSDVTGWDVDADELETVGERIYNMERLMNVRRGVTVRDDKPPWRSMHEPIPDGPKSGRVCPPEAFNRMLQEYYRLRGWSADGSPGQAKLEELGLA